LKRLTIVAALALAGLASVSANGAEFLDRTKDAIAPEILDAAVAAVVNDLRDPGSAQFRGLVMAKPNVLCGFVNGKNGFGGYAGFTPFLYNAANRNSSVLQFHADNEALNELAMLVFKFTGCAEALGLETGN
jgi:hypothetical protein